MNKEWVEQREKEYTEDMKSRKSKIHNFIMKFVTDADANKRMLDYLEDAEKYPWSMMLEFKLHKYLIDNISTGIDVAEAIKNLDELEINQYYSQLQYPEAYSCKRYLDSEPVEFDGDIIITDPCYIIKKRDESTRPKWNDFHQYKSIYEYPDYDEKTKTSKMFSENAAKLNKADEVWQKK